ncbi:MAG: hypothetical protein ACYDB7_06520 [Mycobacteriales bacterium]
MRARGPRALLAVASLAAVAVVSPAMATGQPRPQIEGYPGAWAVPSQNILSGLITVADQQVQVDLTLSAAPTPGLRTVYAVAMYAGCVPYVLDYYWNGTVGLSRAELNVYGCNTIGSPSQAAVATYPATAAPFTSGVLFRAPFAGALRPGLHTFAAGIAETLPTFAVIVGTEGHHFVGGDVAYGTGDFVLGD